jgi:AcrR family transcriptional regulator
MCAKDRGMDTTRQRSPIPDKLKQRLYPAVLDLFSRNDFHQVNIREIYHRSGLSPSTIYKYFPSKEDLLFSILEEKISEIGELVKMHIQGLESIREIFRKIFWVTLEYYDRNPGVAITAFITVPTRSWMRAPSYAREDNRTILQSVLNDPVRRDQLDPQLDAEQLQDLYFMYCSRQIHKWYFHGMRWPLVGTIDRFYPLFWKIVRKP